MKYTNVAGLLLGLLIAPIGCAAAAGDENEAVESGSSALTTENALHSNALHSNALHSNALQSNALHSNALAPAALAAIQDPGPDGDLSRMFVKYTVSCALDPAERFSFRWTDSLGAVHDESYPGELGLAPGWADGPLDDAGQRMVSACLAARTNWYGVPVVISMRSAQDPLRSLTTDDELQAFDHLEGAFWGNLFSPTPHLSACYAEENVANSRAAQRDCATGHLDAAGVTEACGEIALAGSCKHICKKRNGAHRKFFIDCEEAGAGETDYVMTTALP